jgi:carbohydrate diacid regulator
MLRKMAQQIAQTAKDITGYEVLITNPRGIIIGSSRPGRLGQLHTPSLQAIGNRQQVLTAEEEARGLSGVYPGVTLPIEMGGQIIGSVAIAGPPGHVAKFGLLVQKEAEIFLREKVTMESELLREKATQNLVQEIYAFSMGGTEAGYLIERGREIGYDLTAPRLCIILDLHDTLVEPEAEEQPLRQTAQRLEFLHRVRSDFPDPQNIITTLGNDKIVIMARLRKERSEEGHLAHFSEKCRTLEKKLHLQKLSSYFGLGTASLTPRELSLSYRNAWKALSLGKRLRGETENLFLFTDFHLEDLLSTVSRFHGERFTRRILEKLPKQADWEELRRTFLTWCESPAHPGQVSEALGIHRNTLGYRIEKIGKLAGLDIRNSKEAFVLYLALTLREVLHIPLDDNK